MTAPTPQLGDMRLRPYQPPQLYLLVDGEGMWRDAQWERHEVGRLCSRRGMDITYAPRLVPVLSEGEQVIETMTRVIGVRKGRP